MKTFFNKMKALGIKNMAMFFLFYSRPQEYFEFTHKKTKANVMLNKCAFLENSVLHQLSSLKNIYMEFKEQSLY